MQRKYWWAALALFASGSVFAWGFGAYVHRQNVVTTAQRQLEATALVLEQHASRAFEAGDTLLQGIVSVAGPLDLGDPSDAAEMHALITDLRGNSPQISSAWLMDTEGATVAESWAHPPATTGSYAHREYFQAHLRGERGLYIGPLAIGGSSGRPRFTLSRGLFGRDGSFRGVAAAGIFSEYFSDLYANAGPGEGARLRLTRADGMVLAEWPPEAAPDAGEELLVARREIGEYPIRLEVTRPTDAVLAPWRARTALTGVVALAALAAFASLTTFGLRTAAQERRSRLDLMAAKENLEQRVSERTAALEETHTRLTSLLTAAGAGTFIWHLPGGKVESDAGMAALFDLDDDENANGAVDDFLARIHPDDLPRVREKVSDLLGGATRYDDEYRVLRRDGSVSWYVARGVVDENRLFSGAVFDVSELKRAEARAADHEMRLQVVADAVPALISHVGSDGCYRFVNRAYEDWFGVKRRDIIGQHMRDVLGEGAYRVIKARADAALRGETVKYDAEVPYKGAGTRWIEAEYIPNRAADGRVDGFFGFVIDVTDRKRHEDALLEVSARTQALAAERTAILGQLSEGVIVTDPTGRIVFVNEAAASIHGASVTDISPEDFAQAYRLFTLDGVPYPSRDLPLARAVLDRETVTDAHWIIRRPDGGEVVAIGSARPVYTPEGEFLGGVLTLRDDTARRAAEEALAKSQRRLNAVLNNTTMAVFLMDDRQHCVYMNPAAEELTGYRFEETQGRPLHDVVHHTHPDGTPFPIEDCAIDRALPENHHMKGEETFIHRDGHFYPVAYTASPIRDADARAVGTVIEVRDIRAEKEDAERLQLLMGELNHRVKNTLATVQSIARQALRGQDVPAGIRESIESRLHALSRSHDLLTRQEWKHAEFRDVALAALEPFGAADGNADRFALDGSRISLRPRAALTLSMALHELATNAAKYGALSNGTGRVVLSWERDASAIRVFWHEVGGPQVAPPSHRGFGSQLIERGLAYELDGDVRLEFAPDGLRCEIEIPSRHAPEEDPS